jgi:hypothetical protein
MNLPGESYVRWKVKAAVVAGYYVLGLGLLTACSLAVAGPPALPPIEPIDPPEGIQPLLTVSYDGGGWRDPKTFASPQVCGGSEDPLEVYARSVGEFTAYLTTQACGWERGGEVDVTIDFPDGRTQSAVVETEKIFDAPVATYTYQWQPGDPTGPYTFTMRGPGGVVTHTLEIVAPDGPRLYRLANGDLWLYGFWPNEAVRLFEYGLTARQGAAEEYRLVHWQSLYVDEVGQLSVQTDDEPQFPPTYVVVGDRSGEVHSGYPPRQSSILDE